MFIFQTQKRKRVLITTRWKYRLTKKRKRVLITTFQHKILSKFYKCVIVVQPLWKPLQVLSRDQIHFNQMEKRRIVNNRKKNISIRENTVERKNANTLNYTTSNTLNYTPNTLFIIG